MASQKLRWWHIALGILFLLNLGLWITGKLYLYKALVYNYVNIDDLNLFPTRTVEAGTGEPWIEGHDYNTLQLTPELRKTLEAYRSVAFLVIRDDSLRHEEYWDGYDNSSLSNSFSMAKSIISLLVGIAHGEGKIKDLDEPVCNYLPEYCDDTNAKLTIRHLLMMSSGLNYDEGYSSLFSPVTRSYYDSDLRKQMSELKVITEPGKEWNYMSCNTQLLGFILNKATGVSISEYASEKLWKPIHAEHSAQWSLDRKNGDEKAYCCFYSNARDFARIGKLILQKGMWNGKQVIPETFIGQCITPAPITDNGEPNNKYSYQWWLTEREGKKVVYARGILGQYIFVIPDLSIIFVRLGHARADRDPAGEPTDIAIYIDEVMKLYGNQQHLVETNPL